MNYNNPMLGANPSTYTPRNLPQPSMQMPPQHLAHGGSAKKRGSKLISAHFDPQELEVLFQMQGSKDYCKKTGEASLAKMEHLLHNPHIMRGLKEHHAAHGGMMQPVTARDGRDGDTKIALIGPRLHETLDNMAGKRTRNPYDGAPEYFSLGGLFGGLKNMLGGAVSGIGNALGSAANFVGNIPGIKQIGQAVMPMASDALSGLAGSAFGPEAGQFAQQGMNMIGDKMFGSNNAGPNPYQKLGGLGLQAAATRMPQQLQQPMQQFGQQYGSGMPLQQAAQNTAQNTFNNMGGYQGLASSAMGHLNNFMNRQQSSAIMPQASSMPQSPYTQQQQQQPQQQQQNPYLQQQQQQQMPYGYQQ